MRWKWQQPKDNAVFDVITNPINGTIKVFKGDELIYSQEGLSEKSVKLIENNFLSVCCEPVKDLDDDLFYIA